MDHDISTNDKWTMDKVLLKPGMAVDIMNRFGDRERELLQKISYLTDQNRYLEETYGVSAQIISEPLQIQKSVEDYALAALNGLMSDTQQENIDLSMLANVIFGIGEAMVAERDKRGIGK